MIKKILLRLAHKIYNHYNRTIEIKRNDLIKFENGYYGIVNMSLRQQLGCVDVLEIELHSLIDIISMSKTNK